MLFKRRRERNREKEKEKRKKGHRNYKKKNCRYKIDNKYQKAKIKNLEQSLEFQKYNVKKKKKKKRERKKTDKNKQSRKNYKENIGTKLIANTKKHKLKIQS